MVAKPELLTLYREWRALGFQRHDVNLVIWGMCMADNRLGCATFKDNRKPPRPLPTPTNNQDTKQGDTQ